MRGPASPPPVFVLLGPTTPMRSSPFTPQQKPSLVFLCHQFRQQIFVLCSCVPPTGFSPPRPGRFKVEFRPSRKVLTMHSGNRHSTADDNHQPYPITDRQNLPRKPNLRAPLSVLACRVRDGPLDLRRPRSRHLCPLICKPLGAGTLQYCAPLPLIGSTRLCAPFPPGVLLLLQEPFLCMLKASCSFGLKKGASFLESCCGW